MQSREREITFLSSVSRNRIKWGTSTAVGLLIALFAFLSTQKSPRNIDPGDILYIKKGAVEKKRVHLSCGSIDEFSFFADVDFTQKKNKHEPFTVFIDHSAQISFGVLPDGVLYIRWGTEEILQPNEINRKRARENKVSRQTRNHIGFVFKEGKLITYLNGNRSWAKFVKDKTFSPSEIELLPGDGTADTASAAYPILVSRALTPQHLKELYSDSRYYIYLLPKFLFLLFFGTLTSFLVLSVFYPPVFPHREKAVDAGQRERWNVLFLFLINFVFFVVFNIGHNASSFINRSLQKPGLRIPSAYFTLLSVIGLAFLLSFVLKRITGVPHGICLLYTSGLVSLLIFITVVCTFPFSNDIYPIVFNGLFSLLLSFVVAAPGILVMLNAVGGGRK